VDRKRGVWIIKLIKSNLVQLKRFGGQCLDFYIIYDVLF
jgi:hypothetical protein